jgi:hypothetical protein
MLLSCCALHLLAAPLRVRWVRQFGEDDNKTVCNVVAVVRRRLAEGAGAFADVSVYEGEEFRV